MINNYIKKDPDPVQAVKFTGFNFSEINAFLKAKAVYGELIGAGNMKRIRFFDNFTLFTIRMNNYLIYDPKTKLFEVLPELIFEENYEYKPTILSEREEKDA